jgi:hypothetical protein
MLCFMRSMEIHVLETASDLAGALKVGLLLPEHLTDTECSDCGDGIGHANGAESFYAFCVVIDETDRDWVICMECASPVVDGDVRQATRTPEVYESPSTYSRILDDDDEIDFF